MTNNTWSSYASGGNNEWEIPPDGVVYVSTSAPVDDSFFGTIAQVCAAWMACPPRHPSDLSVLPAPCSILGNVDGLLKTQRL